MLPIINTAYTAITPQPSLVATAIPENNTLRVAASTVAPPVSSAQIDPDARNKNQETAKKQAGLEVATQAAQPSARSDLPPARPLGAPATLLAQLMGQTLPPDVQTTLRGMLGEYEKLVAAAYVKYRPSNASMPKAEPASFFTELLRQDKKPVESIDEMDAPGQ